jgi:hypothetical protein
MARGGEVLSMLCPNVEYVLRGSEYENIDWCGKEPAITKKQYEAGFAHYDAWKVEQDTAKTEAKAELLERLGLTQEEFNTLTA